MGTFLGVVVSLGLGLVVALQWRALYGSLREAARLRAVARESLDAHRRRFGALCRDERQEPK
jgi:hypothetical protein